MRLSPVCIAIPHLDRCVAMHVGAKSSPVSMRWSQDVSSVLVIGAGLLAARTKDVDGRTIRVKQQPVDA